jgi:hypothetical protein
MKTLFLTTSAALFLTAISAPVMAATPADGIYDATTIMVDGTFDKRRKPRIPGGSGCDDPRDLIEHPECRG